MDTHPLETVSRKLEEEVVAYAGADRAETLPVGGYLTLLGAYAAYATVAVGGAIALRGRRRGRGR